MTKPSIKLNDIGKKYGTDKSSLDHGYLTNVYETLFPDRFSVNAVLEIGVRRGGAWKHNKNNHPSLSVWAEWFPNATIIGADKRDIKSDDSRITIHKCDQSSVGELSRLLKILPEMDLIIDDGSHICEHQYITFEILRNKLKPKGVYVIEDLHCRGDKTPENKRIIATLMRNNWFSREWTVQIYDSDRPIKDSIAVMRRKNE